MDKIKKNKIKINLKLYSILRDLLPPDLKGRVILELDDGDEVVIFSSVYGG